MTHDQIVIIPFQAGDHIESIEGRSFIGMQHSHVAEALRAIDLETVFVITLIEPRRFQFLRTKLPEPGSFDDLDDDEEERRKKNEDDDRRMKKALNRIALQLEHFIGVNDCQLALELYDAANDRSPKEFASIIATGTLQEFCFPPHVLAIVWNSVNFPP